MLAVKVLSLKMVVVVAPKDQLKGETPHSNMVVVGTRVGEVGVLKGDVEVKVVEGVGEERLNISTMEDLPITKAGVEVGHIMEDAITMVVVVVIAVAWVVVALGEDLLLVDHPGH